MNKAIAAAISGALLAGILTAGIAEAKPIATSLIGGAGIRNAAEAPEWGIDSHITLRGKQLDRRNVQLAGEISVVEQRLAPVDQLGCAEARQVVLFQWVQTAGASTKRTRDDKFGWERVKAVTSDEFGEYKTKFASRGGKFLARAPKDAFTAEYGDLITCKPAESKSVSI